MDIFSLDALIAQGRDAATRAGLTWDALGYRAQRAALYKLAWPAERQLEARDDADAGKPEKLARKADEFAAIKAAFPKPVI